MFSQTFVCILVIAFASAFDPFDNGKYKIKTFTVSPLWDGSPLRSPVYYPDSKESFPPIFFVGGLGGVQGAETYSDFLTQVAAQGYVVIGLDRLPVEEIPLDTWDPHRNRRSLETVDIFTQSDMVPSDPTEYADVFVKQVEWMRGYLTSHKKVINILWNETVQMCHSQGCDVTLNMFLKERSIGRAGIYLDPISLTSRLIFKFPAQVPAFMSEGELSEYLPWCTNRAIGYRRFYTLMPCVKVKMEVKDYGICALANNQVWEVCQKTGICRVNNKEDFLPVYRNFIRGTVVSFIRWQIQGDSSLKKYVTEKSKIKLPLRDFAHDAKRCYN